MPCPTLRQLPPPPHGKTGWPWTAESTVLSNTPQNGLSWPKISIVTPSYNSATFIEATIRSVLLQGYPNLEYIIIDGASTDLTVEIIQKYEPWVTYWVSAPDEGQYDAINKGFAQSTGEIMAWLNSDDMYTLNSLRVVGTIFAKLGHVVHWITGLPVFWDENDFIYAIMPPPRYTRAFIKLGLYDERAIYFIQQESSFWSRNLWLRSGGQMNTTMKLAADFDLWRRFAASEELYFTNVPLGGIRTHPQQRSVNFLDQYYAEVDRSLAGNKFVWALNKLIKNRQGRRLIRFFQKMKRTKVIDYDPKVKQWLISTWEMSK